MTSIARHGVRDARAARSGRAPRCRPGRRYSQGQGPVRARPRCGGPFRVRRRTRPTFPLAAGGTAFGLELHPGSTAPPWTCSTAPTARGGVRRPRARREAPAATAGRVAAGRDDAGGSAAADRRLPRRRERAGRPAAGSARPGAAQPRRPRLLLHGPLAPLLHRRRPPGLAGQERRPLRPVPDLLRTLKDGSELVLLRESPGMLGRRRTAAGDPDLPRLPDTVARLVCFTVLTRTRRGRTKTAAIRVLTTLLDPGAVPAGEIAALYAARWQVETAFLHLKKTVRGAGRALRGRSAALARQEAWALLLVHNMIAALAADAAVTAGPDPPPRSPSPPCCPSPATRSPPTPAAATADKRPTSGGAPARPAAPPSSPSPPSRAADRNEPPEAPPPNAANGPTEEADYDLTIVPSNLPKADISPRT